MKKLLRPSVRLLLLLLLSSVPIADLLSQCVATASGGALCEPRRTTYWGELAPTSGCDNFANFSPYSPGTYFRMPVLQGGCYTISTCGSTLDTQLTLFQGGTTATSFAHRDDNGPDCSGTPSSITFIPAFTDYTRVNCTQYNCLAGGSASITVKVRQSNNLNFTSSAGNMCQGATRTLTATPAAVTGAQANSGSSGTFGGSGVSGTTYTAPTPAGASGVASISYNFGYCSKTQNITIYKNPSTSVAGSDQTVCASSATLAAASPSIGSGTWTVQSGTGTVTTVNSNSSTVTGLVAGSSVTLRWTVSNGPCTSTLDDVVITRDANPTVAAAGSDQTICATTATLAGNTATVGSGVWTLVGGTGTITTSASPTSSVTGLGTGANTFRWTTSNGVCPSTMDDVVITVDAVPTTAGAGPDQDLCDSTATMAGNTPSSGTGAWSLVSGSGTIGSASNPNTGVSSLGNGANTLVWTISNGVCPPSTDTVVITRFNQPTTSAAGSDFTTCDTTINLAGNTPSSGTGTWTLVGGTGTIVSMNSSSSSVTGLGVGTNTFRWTITSGPCSTSADDVVVTRDPPPANPNVSGNQSLCEGDSITLTATSTANGPTYGWWDASTGGTQLSATSVYSSGPLTSTTNVWAVVQDSITTCMSSRVMVTITVDSLPDAPVSGGDQVICAGDAFPTLSVNVLGGQQVTWYDSASSGTMLSTGVTYTPTAGGTFYAETSDSSSSCGSAIRTGVTLTVNALPVPALGGNVDACPGDTTCYDAGPGFVSYMWSTGDSTQTICVTTPGTYIVNVMDSNGCMGADTSVMQIVSPIVANIGADTSACPVVAFGDSSANAAGISWMWNFGDGNTSTMQNPSNNYQGAGNGTYTVELIVTDACGNTDTTTTSVDISCVVGIADGSENGDVRVYPNPNTGRFKVVIEGLSASALNMQLFDMSGRAVFQRQLNDVRDYMETDLDMTSVAKGVYFLILSDGNQKITRKVVIQ